MTPLTQAPPSPDRILETLCAYERSAALKAAIELDLFTAIGEGDDTVPELSARTGAAEHGVRILADYLTVIGYLEKSGDKYALTPEPATYLDRRSPAYLGSIAQFIASPMFERHFDEFTEAVRRGGTTEGEGTLAPEHPVWVEFARAMAPLMRPVSEMLARAVGAGTGTGGWRVLDIAAGHGLFGIAIAKADPRASVVAVDWDNVLAAARENAAAAGIASRYAVNPGSAFTVDFATGFDLALITNFLHHFDRDTCTGLLRRVRAALAPGGRAAILEFIPNEDRITPPRAATFAIKMLATTPAGDAYTYAELDDMCRAAGFRATERHELAPAPNDLVIALT
ncbi:MAG TPA: class I SAM-dependent methyltransferase [Gemmatimonadales bacterium]|nr:class I SAM-dependent methyltransferase [Gemmatimonadales bacterium]